MLRYIQLIAIFASALVSAVTASGLGGDPLLGASIGAGINGAVAGAQALLRV